MRYLAVVYDVSDLNQDEIDGLELEAVVQAETSERHPDTPIVHTFTFDPGELPPLASTA